MVDSSIKKIVVVEGLDKTGKSTFSNIFADIYNRSFSDALVKFSFPNKTSPIGKSIRDELESDEPNLDIISAPNFIAEMTHYWMKEIYNHDYNTTKKSNRNYLFDRYFVSTLAYQAFYYDNENNLNFIKDTIKNNTFLKIPTDLIVLNLPNSIIIERTLKDEQTNMVDAHDTKDESILNKRRDAYKKAVDVMNDFNINIHWIDNVSNYDTSILAAELVGKIFQ